MRVHQIDVNNSIENTQKLLSFQFNDQGFCEGELSSSALSTAVTCIALSMVKGDEYKFLINKNLKWLAENMNTDGGWGDTVDSPSNFSTSLLCWCAFKKIDESIENKVEKYLTLQIGELSPENIVFHLKQIYGNDKTFAVPICMVLAIYGRLGDESDCWKHVDSLPFELSALPQSWYKFFNMNVVSYALPALISIGLLRHYKFPSKRPLRWLRSSVVKMTLNKLQQIQPDHGGFLEASPLTAFVAIALIQSGYGEHAVVKKCEKFLKKSIRSNGSLPIDTNLSIWLTSLSVRAMSNVSDQNPVFFKKSQTWLLKQQSKRHHVYAGSAPGAWCWTHLPGGVPDADDTCSSLIALMKTGCRDTMVIHRGVLWLMNLQNRDGGIPTFCKGWGRLPFDRSCSNITAHFVLVLEISRSIFPDHINEKIRTSKERAIKYLLKHQNDEGSWEPLWFGNQQLANKLNPIYGTSKVLLALSQLAPKTQEINQAIHLGTCYLLSRQKQEGNFSCGGEENKGIEETALAIHALCKTSTLEHFNKISKAMIWLMQNTNQGDCFNAQPIGLYFSSLWYSEKLYPIIFSLDAFKAYKKLSEELTKQETVEMSSVSR